MTGSLGAPAPLPWYRHFWPWFILGLLGTSIVGSLTTVYIAVSGRDPEVHDTWSSDAKSVTRNDAPERFARALGLTATVVSATGDPAIEVTLHSPRDPAPSRAPALTPDRVVVTLVHPTLDERDVSLTLERGADGVYRGALPAPLRGRYLLTIEGSAGASPGAAATTWRIGSRVDLVPGQPVVLGQPPPPLPAATRRDTRTDARTDVDEREMSAG